MGLFLAALLLLADLQLKSQTQAPAPDVQLASAQAPQLPMRSGGLYLKDSEIPKGYRVLGIEIHLAAGCFESVDDLPPGWRLAIDNEASWKASLIAHANPGASSLGERETQKMWIQITRTEAEDNIDSVWGWLTLVSASGNEKRVGLSGASFEFIERYGRHRLR